LLIFQGYQLALWISGAAGGHLSSQPCATEAMHNETFEGNSSGAGRHQQLEGGSAMDFTQITQ